MRLIDADRLLSDRAKSTYYHLPNGDTAIPIIDIEHAPTIVELKKGRWVNGAEIPNKRKRIFFEDITYCSNCHNEAYWDAEYGQQLFDYCPYCGADMRGDKDDIS